MLRFSFLFLFFFSDFKKLKNDCFSHYIHLKGDVRLEDRSYFGPSQSPARLFCFMQYFNNFSLIYVQIKRLNWIVFIFLQQFSILR